MHFFLVAGVLGAVESFVLQQGERTTTLRHVAQRSGGLIRWPAGNATTAVGKTALAFRNAQTTVQTALAKVETRVARDGALVRAGVEIVKDTASANAADVSETLSKVGEANLTLFEVATLAGAGIGPTKVLGAPSASRESLVRNVVALEGKKKPRRDVLSAATAVSDAAHLSRKALPAYYAAPALPPSQKTQAKKDEAKKEDDSNPLGVLVLGVNVFVRLVRVFASVVGPDLASLTARAYSRVEKANADPQRGSTTLLDGLQPSPDAAFKNFGQPKRRRLNAPASGSPPPKQLLLPSSSA